MLTSTILAIPELDWTDDDFEQLKKEYCNELLTRGGWQPLLWCMHKNLRDIAGWSRLLTYMYRLVTMHTCGRILHPD